MLTCANASSAYSSTVAAAQSAAANQASENFAVIGSLAAHDGSSSRYSYLN